MQLSRESGVNPVKYASLFAVFALVLLGAFGRTKADIANGNEVPQMTGHEPASSAGPTQAAPQHTPAKTKISVKSSEARPYDQTTRPALAEIRLDETFSGDIDGESTVRALEVRHDNRSASLISMQRVRGKLGGREGTFVLQGTETVENGKIKATWSVVPGSGTAALSGLRGDCGFEGDFGKGSTGTLNYWFEPI